MPAILSGHFQAVSACAFHPDGRHLVSASEDATLRLWDSATAAAVRVLHGDTQVINDYAISPDSHYILSTSGGNEIQQMEPDKNNPLRLWNLETGECEHIFVFPEELKDRVCTC